MKWQGDTIEYMEDQHGMVLNIEKERLQQEKVVVLIVQDVEVQAE